MPTSTASAFSASTSSASSAIRLGALCTALEAMSKAARPKVVCVCLNVGAASAAKRISRADSNALEPWWASIVRRRALSQTILKWKYDLFGENYALLADSSR